MMGTEEFFDLIKSHSFAEAHACLDDEIASGSKSNKKILNHRKVTLFLSEKKYDDALEYLLLHRTECGSVSHAHETIAMIYEIAGNEDAALIELESAPFDEEEDIYPLLVLDARFYRLFFRAKRNIPINEEELRIFPPDYETYLPANGQMRGVLIRKADIIAMVQSR